MTKMKHTLTALLIGASGAASAATAVSSVSYSAITGTRVTFDTLQVADPDGSLLEGIVNAGGVQFGERFAGQELSVTKAPRPGEPAQDWFDDLTFGTPGAGLTLLAGAAGQNLGVYDYGDADGTALAGIGPKAGGFNENFGFGAISARFASGQSALGFQVREADGGSAFLSLYRGDGSLIETLALGPLDNSFYAVARSDGTADIAGFSLYHSDSYYGIAIDNLTYGEVGVSAVPEPERDAMLLAGLVAVGSVVRRRRGSSS